MRSGFLSALAGLVLLLSAGVSVAQTEAPAETDPAVEAAPVPLPPFDANAEFFVVEGVAFNDLLNIRATPSAGGKLVGRLPNGTALRNHGCKENNGANWCDVDRWRTPRCGLGRRPLPVCDGGRGHARAACRCGRRGGRASRRQHPR